ncbi:hypothetical protein CICLE_v10013916mg [Citrus x clementina]|uniref:Uncharacterized protein n=1 Tax=Citrus clementina TaxID=85681 RepID=V4S6C1_CITCL|nr:hypothetical protein CICLE_v10013916mg [Citrus x clementina]
MLLIMAINSACRARDNYIPFQHVLVTMGLNKACMDWDSSVSEHQPCMDALTFRILCKTWMKILQPPPSFMVSLQSVCKIRTSLVSGKVECIFTFYELIEH